eukprot:g19672.t1
MYFGNPPPGAVTEAFVVLPPILLSCSVALMLDPAGLASPGFLLFCIGEFWPKGMETGAPRCPPGGVRRPAGVPVPEGPLPVKPPGCWPGGGGVLRPGVPC